MSAILDFQALHQFETDINGFLEHESPEFHAKHASLSSIEAEIISFLPKKAAFLFCFCGRPLNISTRLPFHSYRYAHLAKKWAFIPSVTVTLLAGPTIFWKIRGYLKKSLWKTKGFG